MYYIFNENSDCVASCNYEPDAADLESRNETAVVSEESYDISKIKLVNGVIIEVIKELTLAELKKSKLSEIEIWTEGKITGGFISQCTGKPVRYDSDRDTQLTMQGIALNVNTDRFAVEYPTGCPVRGYADRSAVKTIFYLTPEQVLEWCADLSTHIGTCKQAGWSKQAEVNVAQSKEELDAIILD